MLQKCYNSLINLVSIKFMNKIDYYLQNREITDSDLSELEKLGWELYNGGDYTELLFEVEYLPAVDNKPSVSMNLQFTFEWNEKNVYIIIAGLVLNLVEIVSMADAVCRQLLSIVLSNLQILQPLLK